MQYNCKVNVIRISMLADGMGGWTEVENVLHNNLPCKISWGKGSERILSDKDTVYRDAKLFCRVVDIVPKDRIIYKSNSYEIVSPIRNPDSRNRYLSMDIKRIT